jgi:hypothetical protein
MVMSILKIKKEVDLISKSRNARHFQNWLKMIPQVDKVVDGEMMARVEMDMVVEVAMEVEVVAAMEAEVVVATEVVEEIEEVEEDMEVVVVDIKAEVAVVVEVDTEALAVIAGAMMEEWEEAGDLVETVEAWTTTEVLPNSTILSPSIKVCVVATARLILPSLPLLISKSPSHTDNLLSSMLLSIKHARTTTNVLFTLLT